MRVAQANPPVAPAWPRLLADFGGTNARLGWQHSPQEAISDICVLPAAEMKGPADAMALYMSQTGLSKPHSVSMAIASPVLDDEICMTNLAWRFSISTLRQELGCQVLLVLNDFTALALALADLPSSVLLPIGPVRHARPGAMGLIGAGTGLGVSGLIPGATHALPLMGEGGHVTLAASNSLEQAVIEVLRMHHGHVSAERVLSGAGLVSLHQALARVQGIGNEAGLTPADVLALGLNGESDLARQALDLFCGWLGSVAGDLALTLGAVGGIYVGGGIAPRMTDFLLHSSFRQRFTSKGRYRDYLDAIPTWLIDAPVSPALEGAARALEHFPSICTTR